MADTADRGILLAVPALTVPWRYVAVAAGAFVGLLLMGSITAWVPFIVGGTSLGGSGWSDLAASVSTYLWAVAPAVALWRPVVAGVLAGAPFLITVADAGHTWPLALFVSLLACAVCAAWRSRRIAAVLAAAAMVPVLTYAAGATTIMTGYDFRVERGGAGMASVAYQLLLYGFVATGAIGLGTWMRASYLASVRADELENRAEDVEVVAAVVGERARLAHDLHDVVAHHVSLIAVRAETAPYTVSDLSPSAAALLAEIADDSRRALDELRGVLNVLARSSEGVDLAPQPGASDIHDLIERSRRSGDDITMHGGDLTGVGATPGYVAYRVVQESLTNARRHAPGTPVRVEIVAVGGGVLVRVENPLPDTSEPGSAVRGQGIAGMRERVEAVGGEFAVTLEDGRLRVEARVPGEASAAR